MTPAAKAFLLLRLGIGTSFFGHGLVRLPKLDKFSHGVITEFQHSIIPEALVTALAYTLPFAELIIGLLVLLGLFTRHALLAGAIVMLLLIFGTTTIEQWNILDTQLIHLLFFAGLLPFVDQYNTWALDKRIRRAR
jgi:thiosulfate dehydrogenase [quinone] large subunit